MRRILIEINSIKLIATLSDTKTAQIIYNALPFQGMVQRWGDQILFELPIILNKEINAKKNVEVGDIAYWTIGSSLCIFFGRTPFSTGNRPRAFSPVNVFGKIEGNLELLKSVQSQSKIQVKKLCQQKPNKSSKETKGRVISIWRDSA